MKLKLLFFLFIASLSINAHAEQSSGPSAANKCVVRRDKPLMQVGIVTDLHYNRDREMNYNRYYKLSNDKLAEAVETFNSRDVDYTVCLGDVIDCDLESLSELNRTFDKLEKPRYTVLGNHDFLGAYGTDIQNTTIDSLHIQEPYSTKKFGRYRLIFMESNDLSLHSRAGTALADTVETIWKRIESARTYNACHWNGSIGPEQMSWLEKQLDKANKAGEKVVIFSHMPFAPDISDSEWNGHEVDALLQRYPNVIAALSGHFHGGAEAKLGHICYFTFKGMIEGTENAFAIVSFYKDRMVVEGFGAQYSQTMYFK